MYLVSVSLPTILYITTPVAAVVSFFPLISDALYIYPDQDDEDLLPS